jgi:hypothetical protein
MATDALVKIDGVKWYIEPGATYGRLAVPICPKHGLRLRPVQFGRVEMAARSSRELKCEDCTETYKIPRELSDEERYVLDKIDSQDFRKMKTINLDDQAVPIAAEQWAKG